MLLFPDFLNEAMTINKGYTSFVNMEIERGRERGERERSARERERRERKTGGERVGPLSCQSAVSVKTGSCIHPIPASTEQETLRMDTVQSRKGHMVHIISFHGDKWLFNGREGPIVSAVATTVAIL